MFTIDANIHTKSAEKVKFQFLFYFILKLPPLLFLRHSYTSQSIMQHTPLMDFVFSSNISHITMNRIVFLSSSTGSYASIVSSKKGLLSFLFFFHRFFSTYITKTHGKKGNENALNTYTSRSHFCIHVYALQRNQQTEKKREKDRKK